MATPQEKTRLQEMEESLEKLVAGRVKYQQVRLPEQQEMLAKIDEKLANIH